jgi:beta-lactamase superfamily II metal-dependent hydrolase
MHAGMARAATTLDIYFVDVEGGQATLIVTPAGESFLVDTGWGGANGRDAKRIMAAAREAGIAQIDYLLITHFHSDHDGGAPELSRLIPIRTFVDYGEATEKGKKVQEPYEAYVRVRRKGAHLEPKVGDRLPLKGLEIQMVSGRGKTLSEPLSGAGQDNPACTTFKKKANDFTENAKSFGFRLVYGKFTFLDLGDLVWNELGQLVCPRNLLGTADVYLIAHHGNAFSGVPAVTAAVHPRVVIMNNGETKGGDAKTFSTLQGLPGLEDLWQLHRSTNKGTTNQGAEGFIANLSEDTAYRLKLSANEDGSFALTNARTSFTKQYRAK